MQQKTFDHLSIYLTEHCNLACTYCYVNKNYDNELNFLTLKKAVDLFYYNSGKNKNFSFLGGEPILAYSMLLKIIDYIIDLNAKNNAIMSFCLFTNGTRLTPLRVKELSKRKVRIVISLDGAHLTNDMFRRFQKAPYRSVLDTVMKRLQHIPKILFKNLEINMVVTPKFYNSITNNINFFFQKGFHKISATLAAYDFARWEKDDFKVLEQELFKLANYYVSLFYKKKQPFIFYNLECSINGQSAIQMDKCYRLTLGADGNFYFCDTFMELPTNKRTIAVISSVKEANIDFLLRWINKFKKKTIRGIKKIYPSTCFSLHERGLATFCAFGIYHHAKLNGRDPKPIMRDFYKASMLYSGILWLIYKRLEKNKRFLRLYKQN